MGVVVIGLVQQREMLRAQPWVERLQGVQACAATHHVVSKLLSDAAKKEELVRTVAQFVSTGDLRQIEDTIASAEKNLGTLASVRVYVEALKGEFPALEDDDRRTSLSKDLVAALERRKADLARASESAQGAYLSKCSHKPLASLPPESRAMWESEGYRVGRRLNTAANDMRSGPQSIMGSAREQFAWLAQQFRERSTS